MKASTGAKHRKQEQDMKVGSYFVGEFTEGGREGRHLIALLCNPVVVMTPALRVVEQLIRCAR